MLVKHNATSRISVQTAGIIFLLLVCVSCSHRPASTEVGAPLFDNLGDYQWDISSTSPLAQRLFNQGMVLGYGFNHAEAARSFRAAIKQDPKSAMCHWGLAWVLGPNINAPMEDESVREAYDAANQAKRLAPNQETLEGALVEALALRYAAIPVENRSILDRDYARAMKGVYEQFPEHPDVAALYAEALMDLHPWDYWLTDGTGTPQTWTPEIVSVLETLIAYSPDHVGGHHFYIHAVEASLNPERALPSADILRDLAPGAGHLVHMPSHIYIRVGQYHKGTIANQLAAQSDSLYVSTCHAQGLYPLAYYPHNYHFLAATAALEGNGELAIEAAFQVAKHADHELMKEPGWGTLQHYSMIPHYVLVKFAQWDKILELPAPDASLVYPKAVWHYARGMAFLGKDDPIHAREEREALQIINQDTSLASITIWDINSTDQLVHLAELVLSAQLAEQDEDLETAITLLTKAVQIEDQLNYNEPPDWFFSIRHTLGSVFLKAGKTAEAVAVYREDLKRLPENGWALHGLYQSLTQQMDHEEALAVKARYESAWQWADTELKASRAIMSTAWKHPTQKQAATDIFKVGTVAHSSHPH